EPNPKYYAPVYDFKVSERNAEMFAYTTSTLLPDSLRGGLDKDAHRLVVRRFANQDSFYLEGVKEFMLARDEPVVVAHQMAKDSTWDEGILRLDSDDIRWQTLGADAGAMTGLTMSHDGQQVAFLTAAAGKQTQKPHDLYLWQDGDNTAINLTQNTAAWLPIGQRISSERTPRFSDSGDYLYFGLAAQLPERDTNLLDEEIADVEVWRTEDPRLYTQQNVLSPRLAKQTFLSTYRINQGDFLPLASPDMPYESLPRGANGPWVAVYDDRPYAKETTWEGRTGKRNTTLVNLKTGARKEMLNGEVTPARWLEGGKYLVWYNQMDTTWNSFDPAAGKHHVLTTNATGTFYDELNDRPMHPRSYGYRGTMIDERTFLVADRYDLWLLDAAGEEGPVRVTRGREKRVRYTLQDLDPEDYLIDPAQPALVTTFHQDNYHGGVGYLDMGTGEVSEVLVGPKTYGGFRTPRLADGLLYTQGDFREFPDLRFTPNLSKTGGTKISNANPQQANFAWGTNEIYEWTDNHGRTLRGMLVKPDGFDPSKKYPLLVNFYERSSEGVFRHRTPTPGRSSINYSHYVSKGYVIFNPDVVYRRGYPGESAYDCVMSGVTSLLDKGFIDKERIGLQGHSWGGYQAAYLVTKTDLFAAVESGAPVVNMFSAYGGIRWGSGLSRQFQYERTQSRIGGTPWEYPLRYLENSPIFTTDKINTPLLILHNDNDGAVPWYQGIEWFTALRRLGKLAWMLNYRGEPHWPVKPANRFDFQTRMAQFFDHYLMDAPMPKWMVEGVSPLERGKEQNLETRE
ncbi:MAG: prolyl oligopeptidase family serine peptidase, partial [Bacteroidota bacterium]